MKTILASCLAASVLAYEANVPVSGSKACVANQAGFVLNWWYEDINIGEATNTTDNYPIDQTQCMDFDLSAQGAKSGDFVQVYVHAVLGTTNVCNTPMIYDPTGPVLTFTTTGTTLNFSCRLNQ